MRRTGKLVWVALATAVVLLVGPGSGSSAGPAGGPSSRGIAGIVPVSSGKVSQFDCSGTFGCGGGQLTYHGGAVMRTNATYAIFWLPPGFDYNGNNAGYENTLTQYLGDVAHDSGLRSNVFAGTLQYYDTVGGGTNQIAYDSTFAGSVVVHDALPSAGSQCDDQTGLTTACVYDNQAQAEIKKVVQAHSWPQNGSTLYFLFTPPGLGSCFDGSDPDTCAYTAYCAYHSSLVTTGGEILYANQPWTSNAKDAQFCDESQYPNGGDADPTINVMSHEFNETVTDPNVNAPDVSHPAAWYDSSGYENGDKCAWTFGSLSGASGSAFNQTINGHHYFTQEEYDNASETCIQTKLAIAPTISGFSPSSGIVGSTVTIDGTGFDSTSAPSFNGTPATSFTIVSGMKITATVPTDASTGTISVQTNAGTGTSVDSFTVTTAPPAPPILTSFSPTKGPAGTTIVVAGTGLTGTTAVLIGKKAAKSFNVVSDNEVDAVVDAGSKNGKITVTNPSGSSSSKKSFSFVKSQIKSFKPTKGPVGTIVSIKGLGLSLASAVSFNGTPAQTFTIVNDKQINATVATDTSSGAISVTTPAGVLVSKKAFAVTP